MAKTDELEDFIRLAVAKGEPLSRIEGVLLDSGWETERVKRAVGRYVEMDFPAPVPKPRPFVSARLFFMHFFYFILLYLVTYNTVSILFSALDHYLPDGLGRYRGLYYSRDLGRSIQDNLAILIVAAPLLILTQHLISGAQERAGQAIPRIRLTLAYFTMFVGALVIFGTACSAVYYLLRGELGLRFLIKAAILLALCMGLFLHYRLELSQDEAKS